MSETKNRSAYSQEIRTNRQRAVGAVAAAALAGAGLMGINSVQHEEQKTNTTQEQGIINEADAALNQVVVLKEGVAIRSAPKSDSLEGSEPTLIDRVKQGKVLRTDRPVVSVIDGEKWIAFAQPDKDIPESEKGRAENMFWVNLSGLTPGANYEVFEYPNTYSNTYRTEGDQLVLKHEGTRLPKDVGNAATVPAEIFYEQMIQNENLAPADTGVQIGEAFKTGR